MISLLILFLAIDTVFSAESQYKTRLTQGWEFLKGDLGSPFEAFREGKNAVVPIWTKVSLPHSYNAEDAVDPDVNFYQGPAWYRTKLELNNPYENGRTVLHFEGAGQKTQVYIYTTLVGSHDGGYDEFDIDISDAVKAYLEAHGSDSKSIPLAIRTDNSRDVSLIPSDLSDFNVYGGIYRYLNLVYLPSVCLENIHISPSLNAGLKKGEVQIAADVFRLHDETQTLDVEGIIYAPNGKVIQTFNASVPSGTNTIQLYAGKVKSPVLWSPDKPDLYRCHLKIRSETGVQEISENFGFRSFEFVNKGPFLLNGERLLLRGTHRHEDHAGVGPAMTEEQIIKEMEMMKAMGVNFIRLGHYQQSRIVLEACDRLGILVWEEIPWCRGGLGGALYQQRAKEMLRNMIKQHYNHPAVIIWGLGNENDWPGDFEVFEEAKIRAFMKELNDLSHSLDPSRKTAIRRCDFCKDIVDVYSPSIWAGWYRGKYTDYREVSKKNWDEVDHFLHVEWGASHHARRHSNDPDKGLENIRSSDAADEREGDFLMQGGEARVSRDGTWTESYAVNLVDWHLKEQENMDWLTGTAYWPFKDFSTPLRPENPVPYVNQKGVVERDFTPKETYFVFQSYWTTEPMVHIYGHSWPVRWGEPGEKSLVKVYSNCSEVELFLNGISQGIKSRNSQDFPAAGLRWSIDLMEGDNVLKAIAYDPLGTVLCSDEIDFEYQEEKWGAPAQFSIEEICRDGDMAKVSVQVADTDGVPCLDARDIIRFGLAGDGKLIDNQGTSSGSRKVQLYNGRAMIWVRLNSGKSVVSVSGKGLPTAFITLSTKGN